MRHPHAGRVRVGVGGNNTTLLVAGNKAAHAAWARMLARDRLDDVRLCLKEYALRHKQAAHPAWPAAAELGPLSHETALTAAR